MGDILLLGRVPLGSPRLVNDMEFSLSTDWLHDILLQLPGTLKQHPLAPAPEMTQKLVRKSDREERCHQPVDDKTNPKRQPEGVPKIVECVLSPRIHSIVPCLLPKLSSLREEQHSVGLAPHGAEPVVQSQSCCLERSARL